MDKFLSTNAGVSALVYVFITPIIIGLVYFNKPMSFENYYMDFTSTVGKIYAIWGSYAFGLGFAAAIGLFLGIKIALIVLPFFTLIGYVIGCALGCFFQTMGVPILIRVIPVLVSSFWPILICGISLQVNNIRFAASQVINPLVIAILITLLFIRVLMHYRRLATPLLILSEFLVIFYLILLVG